jgi:predicted ribosome quality control (RQC) complex YloA/Tae2 family protein
LERRLLDACIEALRAQIAPRAQILDVAKPGEDRVDLLIEREGGRARLAIDLAPAHACVYLARPLAAEAPDESLRRLLVGQWISQIDRPVDGPLMRLLLSSPGATEVGLWLVVEWLGGRPDMVVVDGAREEVLATLNVPAGAHALRRARGARYAWPPHPHRPDYGKATEAQVAAALDRAAPNDRVRALVRGFAGLPSYLAYDALHRGNDVAGALRAIADEPFDPVLYEGLGDDLGLPCAFVSPIPLPNLEPHRSRRAGTFLRLIEHAHATVLRAEQDGDARGRFLRLLGNEERRLMRLHERLRAESADANAAPLLRRQAEALLVHMGEIPRGASSFTCPDPQDPGRTLVIELDPRRSASNNADAIFRRVRRLERGTPLRARRIRAIEEAIARLSVLRSQIAGLPVATKGGELLRTALGPFARGRAAPPEKGSKAPERSAKRAAPSTTRPQGQGPPSRRRPEERFHPRTYTTKEGWTVLVGRSNEENDYVTHALARPEDYWFHAHGCPGSHVVLRREGRKDNPSVRTLEEAASIAAWFSKARTSRKAPIVYTLKKYVRRPRKGPPGLALVTREKLILVEPKAPPDADRGGWTDDEDDTS